MELQRELGLLTRSLSRHQVPVELESYKELIIGRCNQVQREINRNFSYLKLNQATILQDVLSRTQQITQEVRLLSSMRAVPILRATSEDRITLSTIKWLHESHPSTNGYPPAFINGNCAIFPFLPMAPIYVFPTLEQRTLLYQPLLFHEFGHLLYSRHKPEMDMLVQELQRTVDDLLIPGSQRNDRYAGVMTTRRQAVAYTWYAWAQELFCDAVGFTIGGICFLRAFSAFLGTRDQGNYYREPKYLEYSSHPVTWLRVRLICRRAKNSGLDILGKEIENEWRNVASLIGVTEDYHGYYDQCLDPAITQTIEDMLTEVAPRQYARNEGTIRHWDPKTDSPVRLFNWSWQVYSDDIQNYAAWEAEQVSKWLDSCS